MPVDRTPDRSTSRSTRRRLLGWKVPSVLTVAGCLGRSRSTPATDTTGTPVTDGGESPSHTGGRETTESSSDPTTDANSLRTVEDRVEIAGNEPYCAFTDLTRLDDETLVAVYNAGEDHLDSGLRIELRRSTDGGRTWSAPSVVVEPINEGYGVRDPHVAQLQDGRLVLVWFSYRTRDVYSSITTHVRTSHDDGETWSDPRAVDSGPFVGTAASNRPLELDDDRLLLSIHGKPEKGADRELLGVAVSTDGGDTWPTFHEIHQEPQHQGMECELAQLPGGEIVALARRTDRALGLRFVSSDGGRTWSEPEEVPVGHAPGLLADGDRLLVNHRAKPDGEPAPGYDGKGTVVSLSLDGGRSFVDHLPLGFPIQHGYGGDTAYGGIVTLPDGDYYTSYYSPTADGVRVFGQRFRAVARTPGTQTDGG
jgi:hypothetical protein